MALQLASPSIRLAQLIGITSSAWLSGSIANWSYGAVQSILDAGCDAQEAARLYKYMHAIGSMIQPAIIPLPTLCFAYLACYSHNGTGRALYSFCASAVGFLVPWTLIGMESTYRPLVTAGENAEKRSGENLGDVHALLRQWQRLNWVRAVSSASASVVGAWALVYGF